MCRGSGFFIRLPQTDMLIIALLINILVTALLVIPRGIGMMLQKLWNGLLKHLQRSGSWLVILR